MRKPSNSGSLHFRILEPLGGRRYAILRYAYTNVCRQLVRTLPSGYHYRAVYGGYGTSRIGEWHLNHSHSMNHAEVINVSHSDFSAEIDYRYELVLQLLHIFRTSNINSYYPHALTYVHVYMCAHIHIAVVHLVFM